MEVLVKRKFERQMDAELLLVKESLTPDEFLPLKPETGTDRVAKHVPNQIQAAAE